MELDGIWRPEYLADGAALNSGPGWYAVASRPKDEYVVMTSYHGPHSGEQACWQWCAEANARHEPIEWPNAERGRRDHRRG